MTSTPDGAGAPLGGSATTIEGMISKTAGNAGNWADFIGKAPFGAWDLALPNTAAQDVLGRLHSGDIEDILLVVSYEGDTPPWT